MRLRGLAEVSSLEKLVNQTCGWLLFLKCCEPYPIGHELAFQVPREMVLGLPAITMLAPRSMRILRWNLGNHMWFLPRGRWQGALGGLLSGPHTASLHFLPKASAMCLVPLLVCLCGLLEVYLCVGAAHPLMKSVLKILGCKALVCSSTSVALLIAVCPPLSPKPRSVLPPSFHSY